MTHFAAGGDRTRSPERLGAAAWLGTLLGGVNIPRPRGSGTPADFGLPYEAVMFSGRDDLRLAAWYVPASSEGAPLVVAFHGYAASKSALLPVAAALRELDCATLLVDFYGSGDSSGDGTSLGYLEAADVAAALDYARGRWPGRKVGLYGFSMGSAAILRAIAVADADPDAIVLEATFDDLLSTAKNRFDSMGLPATPLAELLLFWGGVQWGFDPFTHNPADYAAAVRCPAMVLHGERDARATLDQGRRVAAAMGEHATFVANPGLGHMPGVIADRTAWKRDVGGFLARNLTASDGDGLTGSGG